MFSENEEKTDGIVKLINKLRVSFERVKDLLPSDSAERFEAYIAEKERYARMMRFAFGGKNEKTA